MAAPRIFAFARTSRCAIVAVGNMNAPAISSVVNPQTVRKVSATCASAASAGWQQVKIRRKRSSGTAHSSVIPGSPDFSGAVRAANSVSFSAKRVRRRILSMALCLAVA